MANPVPIYGLARKAPEINKTRICCQKRSGGMAEDIRRWQNELIKKGYSPTYLKTINNQLSAIFNYAVKYYDLKGNR